MKYSQEFKNSLKDVISILKDKILILKAKQSGAKGSEIEYINARLLSYREIINNIRGQLKEFEISEEEIGLDKLDEII